MPAAIHYRDFLKELESYDHERSDKTFKMKYIKCNRGDKTGGQIIVVEAGKKCGLPFNCKDHEMIGLVPESGRKTAIHLPLVMEFNDMQIYK